MRVFDKEKQEEGKITHVVVVWRLLVPVRRLTHDTMTPSASSPPDAVKARSQVFLDSSWFPILRRGGPILIVADHPCSRPIEYLAFLAFVGGPHVGWLMQVQIRGDAEEDNLG